MSLKLSDLHEIFSSVSIEEAKLIANLGAQCWIAFKEELYSQWKSGISSEDSEKAECWRQEGRMSAIEGLKSRLMAAEEAISRTAIAEGRVASLKASMESETERRVAEVLGSKLKDAELVKMREMSELREKIASLESKEQMIKMLQDTNRTMTQMIETQKLQIDEIKEAQTKATTKSSHAIGKQGEASILSLLEGPIMENFPYSSVKNMSGVSHSADFHLFIMTENGTRKKILVDSKKYARAVDSKEISKLNSDVDMDEEADAGILISISSNICTKKQFQIKKTEKQKPILFITFVGIEEEKQKDIVCWGIQSLIQIIGEADLKTREKILEGLDRFLDEINTSIKDLDKVISSQIKTTESIRQIRSDLFKKLTFFKKGEIEKSEEENLVIEEKKEEISAQQVPQTQQVPQKVETNEGCITIFKATGLKCGKPVLSGFLKCRAHLRMIGKPKV